MEKILSGAVVLLICLSVSSCAQTKNVAVRSTGFFMIPSPGTIMADENGQAIDPVRDTVFTLYVETKNPSVKWETAWKNNRSFSVIPQPLTTALVVGETKSTGRKISLSPSTGNTLWQLELSDDQQKTRPPQSVSGNEVLLKGVSNKKPFFVKLSSLTELASPLYQ
jgi:hypothetical protein